MKQHNLTEGSVGKGIFLFALPLLGSSLIQQLYSTVDLVFVGQLMGTESAAAIGASDLLITCIVGFFNGMAIGTSVIAAQLFGANKFHELKKLTKTIFYTGVVGGLGLMGLAIFFTPIFLSMMGTPSEIYALAIRYLRIYSLSLMSIVLYNLLSGYMRALGDSKTPMLFQAMGGLLNVFSDFLFIVVFKMGVEGTAIATFLSQTFAAVCAVIYFVRMRTDYSLSFGKGGFDVSIFMKIVRIGVPAGIQAIIITLSNILIQSQINRLGVESIAAFTVYFKTEMVLYLPILATGQALVSFVGQNYGAGRFDRIKQGNRLCRIVGAIGIFVLGMLLMLNSSVILKIFTQDKVVIGLAGEIMRVTFPLYFICMLLECFSSNLRGLGEAFAPMVVTVISYCGFRLLLLFTFMKIWHSVGGVALCYPLSWAIACILMMIVTKQKKYGI